MASEDVVSCNGEWLPLGKAQVPVFAPALLHAFGVYESIQVIGGVPFHLTAHLRRLERSARFIELPLPAPLAKMATWVRAFLAQQPHGDHLLRIVVTGPSEVEGSLCWLRMEPLPQYPPRYWTLGADAITFPAVRPLPQAKTLNTLTNYLAQRAAHQAGCHEGLLVHDGKVWEGSSSNLFVVQNDVLLTPPGSDVLSGETRECVLALAAELGVAACEATLSLTDRSRWTEAFLTSTSRHVLPLTKIDRAPVGTGQIGPVTRRLHDAFEAYFRRELARAADDRLPT